MFSLDYPLKKLDKGTHKCFLDDEEATVVVSSSLRIPFWLSLILKYSYNKMFLIL